MSAYVSATQTPGRGYLACSCLQPSITPYARGELALAQELSTYLQSSAKGLVGVLS